MPDTITEGVKAGSASPASNSADVKALDSLIDGIMSNGKASSAKPTAESEVPATENPAGEPTGEPEETSAPDPESQPEPEQLPDDSEKEEQEEPATDAQAEPEAEAEEKPSTEKAIPYERFKEVNDKLVASEPIVKEYNELIGRCKQASITAQQFEEGLQIMGLVNSKPEEALAKFEQYAEQLRIALGKGLPADLAAKVEAGTLAEEDAKQLARYRLQEQAQQRNQQTTQQQQAQQQQQEVLGAFQTWLTTKQSHNPSFKPSAKGEGLFEDFLTINAGMVQMSQPKNGRFFSPLELTAIAEKAYNKVLQISKLASIKPQKKAFRPSQIGQRSTAVGEPKSFDDVVSMIAQKHKMN